MEAELQREVEELKLRLHMAAEHYKEKYRECQRLRRQVAKLTSGDGVSREMGRCRRVGRVFEEREERRGETAGELTLVRFGAGGQEERVH